MAMYKIKPGEPQPEPCNHCGGKYGYQFTDYMRTNYSYSHNARGEYELGFYSEMPNVTNRGKTAFCTNCGNRLKFKIIRNE